MLKAPGGRIDYLDRYRREALDEICHFLDSQEGADIVRSNTINRSSRATVSPRNVDARRPSHTPSQKAWDESRDLSRGTNKAIVTSARCGQTRQPAHSNPKSSGYDTPEHIEECVRQSAEPDALVRRHLGCRIRTLAP